MEKIIAFRIRVNGTDTVFENVKELETAIKSTNKELKEASNAADYDRLTSELAQMKAEKQKVNAEIRIQTKLFKGLDEAEGTYKRISAETSFLTDSLKSLNRNFEGEQPVSYTHLTLPTICSV